MLLRERILTIATERFLKEGYGATTIEAVAAGAGVSKRTLYHRFSDKTALFAAVVHRIIEEIRPPPGVPLLKGATLHDVLRRLGGLILRAALTPRAIALHRLVTAESARFPSLARAVYDEGGAHEAIKLIGELLQRQLPDIAWTSKRRTFAAQLFLQMVVAAPQRRALGLGTPMSKRALEVWANEVAALFLHGCHGFPARGRRVRVDTRRGFAVT